MALLLGSHAGNNCLRTVSACYTDSVSTPVDLSPHQGCEII